MFMLKHVRVFEKSRTCLKKFMYVFFYKMIGIQLYMFKSYNNSTLQSFVIKDIADIYRVSKKRLKCDSKRRWGDIHDIGGPVDKIFRFQQYHGTVGTPSVAGDHVGYDHVKCLSVFTTKNVRVTPAP